MKANVIHDYGDAGQLIEAELPVPSPQEHEVLVEIHAASLNAVGWKT